MIIIKDEKYEEAINFILKYTCSSKWKEIEKINWTTSEIADMMQKFKYDNKKNDNLPISNIIDLLPTEYDCMIVGQQRKGKLPKEYDKASYELGFHQAYNWILSQIYK